MIRVRQLKQNEEIIVNNLERKGGSPSHLDKEFGDLRPKIVENTVFAVSCKTLDVSFGVGRCWYCSLYVGHCWCWPLLVLVVVEVGLVCLCRWRFVVCFYWQFFVAVSLRLLLSLLDLVEIALTVNIFAGWSLIGVGSLVECF